MQWVRQGGGAGYDCSNGVAAGINDSAFIIGKLGGNASFGRTNVLAADHTWFLAKTAPAYSLETITLGGGSITSVPVIVSYPTGTNISLTASPNPGWTFLQWLGDANGTNSKTEITMTRKKCVEAVFGTTMNTLSTGAGVILTQPDAAIYPYGTVLRATAVPQPGSAFLSWGGAATGANNPAIVSVTSPSLALTAEFASLTEDYFSLALIADGYGAATASPSGNRFAAGTTVTLTATADPDQQFLGWIGDAHGLENPLRLAMDSHKIITAQFTKRPRIMVRSCSEPSLEEGFQFLVIGELGGRYEVERTDDWSVWSSIALFTNHFGSSQVIDVSGTDRPYRIYRVSVP